jgi:hypothetical protein
MKVGISLVEMFNVEASTLNDVGNRSVEMASAGTALPQRGEMILPPPYARLRGKPVFDKQ